MVNGLTVVEAGGVVCGDVEDGAEAERLAVVVVVDV